MKITAAPDPEDSELDPMEPLGSIVLEDDDGRELLQHSIWLDDWLGGIREGLHAIETGASEMSIDLRSEPDPLVWKSDGRGVTIEYRTEVILIRDLPGFTRELKRVLSQLTDLYRAHQNWSKCDQLRILREWAEAG